MKKIIVFIFIAIFLIIGVMVNSGSSIFSKNSYTKFPDQPEVKIPVLMYHHFIESGEGNSITITRSEFEEQMQTLKQNGYTAVTDKEILAYYKDGAELPKKPIHITIDDGYTSNYDIAYPILKQEGLKATIFTVISQVGQQPGTIPHFTWEQAKEMENSGVISIQNHTYDLHFKETGENGKKSSALITPKANETEEELYQRVVKDFILGKETMLKNLGKEPISISYPYGSFNADSIKAAKEAGLELAYTIKKGVNDNTSHIYTLDRINVPHGWNGKDILKAIE